MNRPTTTALTAASILLATACTTGKNTPTNTAAHPPTTHAPTCSDSFPASSGITVHNGTVTGTVHLNCTPAPADPLVSLTLAYHSAPGSPSLTGGGRDFTEFWDTYDVAGHCHPGIWSLHILYIGIQDGQTTTDAQWGTPATITAADCAR